MRLPNGFGNVSKLPGKRRKPWRARRTEGWKYYDKKSDAFFDKLPKDTDPLEKLSDGELRFQLKQVYKTIGYYETRQDAIQALAEYNANPFDIRPDVTFAEVYDKWSAKKYEEISRANVNGYKAAYKLCESIAKMPIIEIKLPHLQGIVDSSGKNHPMLKKLKSMISQVYDYAVMNEIIPKGKHIVKYIDIGTATKSTKHYRFTDDEIKTMWLWSNQNEYIQLMLMLIYTGVRPGELFNTKKENVNLQERYFYIEKGKNQNAVRKVPIPDKVFPFFQNWMQKDSEYIVCQLNGKGFRFDTNHGQYTDSYWKPLLLDMGILNYTNEQGEQKEHTPDDTRHTFTTMWKEKKLDEAMRRKIQGHSGKGIGEMVYTHFELEKLREEMNKL